MDKPVKKGGSGKQPESYIVDDLTHYMMARGWLVMKTHGNKFQQGFPDLYCAHREYKTRWIEVKQPHRKVNPFTEAQLRTFQEFAAKGVGVWVLTAGDEKEYKKLWLPANWYTFLHIPDVSGT